MLAIVFLIAIFAPFFLPDPAPDHRLRVGRGAVARVRDRGDRPARLAADGADPAGPGAGAARCRVRDRGPGDRGVRPIDPRAPRAAEHLRATDGSGDVR